MKKLLLSATLIAAAFIIPYALMSFLTWDLQWYLPSTSKEHLDGSGILRFFCFFLAAVAFLGALYLIIEEIYHE